jgi:predicted permease
MPLFNRKSQKLSYFLDSTGRNSILACVALMMVFSFVHWFFRGALFESAKPEYDNTYKWSIIWVSLLAVVTALTGIKITDRTEDRDP